MGYRSEVRCVIYGDPDKLQALITKHMLSGSGVMEYFNESMMRYRAEIDEMYLCEGNLQHRPINVEVLELYGDNWKWYDGYSDVQAFTAMRDDAPRFGLAYEFIRIGEETSDVEVARNMPDGWHEMLGTNTSMYNDFCAAEELDVVSGLLVETNNVQA